jgi:hypothetical protein
VPLVRRVKSWSRHDHACAIRSVIRQFLPSKSISSKLVDEVLALVAALPNAGRTIGEVEETHALRCRMSAIEGADPAPAAALRAKDARIGLR